MSDFIILGLLGPAGTGKDLVADRFAHHNLVKVAFADPIKRFLRKAFDLSYDQLWGESDKRDKEFDINESWWLNAVDSFNAASTEIITEVLDPGVKVNAFIKLYEWFTRLRSTYGTKISPRIILQTLGTEWGREVDPLMWARYGHRIANKLRSGYSYTYHEGLFVDNTAWENPYAGVVIPDHRFINEVRYTNEQPGTAMIRLKRPAYPGKEVGIAGHKSEEEHKNIPDSMVDLVMELPEGIEKVHAIVDEVYANKEWMKPKSLL